MEINLKNFDQHILRLHKAWDLYSGRKEGAAENFALSDLFYLPICGFLFGTALWIASDILLYFQSFSRLGVSVVGSFAINGLMIWFSSGNLFKAHAALGKLIGLNRQDQAQGFLPALSQCLLLFRLIAVWFLLYKDLNWWLIYLPLLSATSFTLFVSQSFNDILRPKNSAIWSASIVLALLPVIFTHEIVPVVLTFAAAFALFQLIQRHSDSLDVQESITLSNESLECLALCTGLLIMNTGI
jgi:hypothetical protein